MKKQNGFIKIIILIIIILIILGYFGFNAENLVKSPMVLKNLAFVWGLVGEIWNRFIEGPIYYLWNNIVIDLVWNNLQKLIGAR